MQKICRVIIAIFILLWLVNVASAGDIVGTVRIAGAKDASNVVVYIDKIAGKTFTPPAKHPIMDQSNMTFVPHVLPVLIGTTVDFPNSDVVRHNVFSPTKMKRFNLGTYPAGVTKTVTFDKPGKVVLLCNVHPEMSAYILVVETPYFAVTGKDGKYKLENVPPGKYRLVTWHEKLNPKAQDIEVRDGNVVVDFELID
jgi:plastocyanin